MRDAQHGVGCVIGDSRMHSVGGDVVEVFTVDFWGKQETRRASVLSQVDDNSDESMLLRQPQKLQGWVYDAPLRLAALAVSLGGGAARAADIKQKLEGRVVTSDKWAQWWKTQSRAMVALPNHFQITKTSKGNEYRLLATIADVPPIYRQPAKPRPVTVKDWKKWLLSNAAGEPPGRFPTKALVSALEKWNAPKDIEQVLTRLAVTAESLLNEGKLSPRDAGMWFEAVAAAAACRRRIGGPDPRGYDAARAGEVLVRLRRATNGSASLLPLLRAGALDGEVDAWRRGFLDGAWQALGPGEARELFTQSAGPLGRQARDELAANIVLSAFGFDFTERRRGELDRLLDTMPEPEQQRLLWLVIAAVAPDQRDNVLAYVARSRHAAGDENLPLRVAAALILTGGQGEFAERVSRELAGAFDALDAHGPALRSVLAQAACKLEDTLAAREGERLVAFEALQSELEAERLQRERFQRQARDVGAEADSLTEQLRRARHGEPQNSSN